MAKTDRSLRYTKALGDKICAGLAEGRSLRSMCAEEGMPAASTVVGWWHATSGAAFNARFAERYDRARKVGWALLADEILDIADTPMLGVKTKKSADGEVETTEGDMIEHRRLQVDTRKWMLAKMMPKVYGDKLETTHKGDPGAPMHLVVNGSDVHG